jgi:extracellular elastinolytic metalloproteinase
VEEPTDVMVPKAIVIELPESVDVTELGVDPAATCGDGGSASLGQYTIELSPDGTTWTQSNAGTFALANRGQLNPLTPSAGQNGVKFVRLTMLGNQTENFALNCPDGPYSGCVYTDVSEIAVYGTPSP